MGQYGITVIDAADKSATARFNTGPINAATIAEVSGQAAAFLTALDPIIRGNVKEERLSAYVNLLQSLPPSDEQARRVLRWRITWVDTTQYLDPPVDSIPNPNYNKTYTDHIPTADAVLCSAGSNEVDLTVAPWPAFVTAFQALVRSPSNGQPQIISVVLLDR